MKHQFDRIGLFLVPGLCASRLVMFHSTMHRNSRWKTAVHVSIDLTLRKVDIRLITKQWKEIQL